MGVSHATTCRVALRKVEAASTFSATCNANFRCETSYKHGVSHEEVFLATCNLQGKLPRVTWPLNTCITRCDHVSSMCRLCKKMAYEQHKGENIQIMLLQHELSLNMFTFWLLYLVEVLRSLESLTWFDILFTLLIILHENRLHYRVSLSGVSGHEIVWARVKLQMSRVNCYVSL